MAEIDERRLGELSLQVWKYKEGEAVSLMMHVGHELGLYRAMAGAGPVTADQLAQVTGYSGRWLLEWLRGQAAAGLIASECGDVFEMTAEAALVLADDTSARFAAGAFVGPVEVEEVVAIRDAFRSGIGRTYEQMGRGTAESVEASFAPVARALLVPALVPRVADLADRLDAGAAVVDVGCGSGLVIELLAAEFPEARFAGFDPSSHAIALARARLASNHAVTLHHAAADDLPTGATFDVALAFDCLHDMPRPDQALGAIRRSLRDDGVLVVKEIRSSGDFATDRKNPVLALMYATSVRTCLASATSSADGHALGTLGLDTSTLTAMCRRAGFSTVDVHDIGDPVNLYYEVRP